MSAYKRDDWVDKFLRVGILNPDPTPAVKLWVNGWSANEISNGGRYPANNLLASGYKIAGSTDYNSAGVQNYQTESEGAVACAAQLNYPLTTRHSEYLPLHQALQSNDENALGVHGSASAVIRTALATWSGNAGGYASRPEGFVSTGQSHQNDLFQDSGNTGGGTSSGGSGNQALTKKCDKGQSCIIGQPLACPTNWTCYPVDDNGCPDPSNFIAFTGFCFPPETVEQQTGGSNPTQAIADFLANIGDIKRDAKVVIGGALVLLALVLVGSVVTGKVSSNPIVKTVAKVAA